MFTSTNDDFAVERSHAHHPAHVEVAKAVHAPLNLPAQRDIHSESAFGGVVVAEPFDLICRGCGRFGRSSHEGCGREYAEPHQNLHFPGHSDELLKERFRLYAGPIRDVDETMYTWMPGDSKQKLKSEPQARGLRRCGA